MAAYSGIKVQDEVVTVFTQMKTGHQHGCLVLHIVDQKEVAVLKTENPGCEWTTFVEELPNDDCRFAVFDCKYEIDGALRKKLAFIHWAPQESKVRSKMIYASTKDAVKKKLEGIATEIQADCKSELLWNDVIEKLQKTK